MDDICSDAGTLGREVHYPGPAWAFMLEPHGLIIPRWLAVRCVEEGLLRDESLTPLYGDPRFVVW